MNNDLCTPEGARRLKARIEAYWAERGYDVNVDLVEARTDVRSNLVNGMPTRPANDVGRERRSA